ncbi:BglG family transcription antiterminator [Faecalibaculum rodentium]|uniref:BglG family transcription antiterminator n=1 Tax=Faecalibaculum rodentium TaxID=1702221 RepID=UPI0023F3D6EC|nr:PTS sugar transporter subunit IIA [Faecalibaculum rodentium]
MSQTTLDSNVNELLRILLREQTASASSLASSLGISEKAVRLRIRMAEEFLQTNNLGSIEKRPRVGMTLNADSEQLQRLKHYLNNVPVSVSPGSNRVNEVIARLFLLGKGQTITTRQLSDSLYLSSPTILKTVREARQLLEPLGLQIINEHGRGLYLEGPENEYRTALAEFVQNRLASDEAETFLKKYFYGLDLDGILHVIQRIQQEWNCQLSTASFQNALILCGLACRRQGLKTKLYIPQEDVRILEQYSEYMFAAEILKAVSTLTGIQFTKEEVSFLAIRIICFGFVKPSDKQPVWKSIDQYDQTLAKFVDDLVENLSQILEKDLASDSQFRESLAYHLRSAIFRLRHGDQQKNSLLPYIKQEYHQLFKVSWYLSLLFEKYFAIQITEDELGYVVLLIQAALERRRSSCTVAVVADFSRSYASLITQRLRKYMPEITAIHIVSRYDPMDPDCRQADFILSRISIEQKDPRIIMIGNLLEDRYMTELMERLRQARLGRRVRTHRFSPICHPLFHPELTFVSVKASTKEEVLHEMCEVMEKQGFVKPGFYESVMQRENLVSTYIGDGVSLPHGNPEFVNQSKVAIAVLDHPVLWDHEEKSQFVVLLGMKLSTPEDKERAQVFYKELIALLEQKDELKKLKELESAFDLYTNLIR